MIYPLVENMQVYMKKYGLTTEDIDAVIGVTKSVFGLDWLEKNVEKRSKIKDPLSQHPIIVAAASGSFSSLIELIELCTYLVAFKNDPELKTIISLLKAKDSYADGFLPIAIAYRFHKLGFQMGLEPAILNGRLADFSAKKGDLDILGECTVLREWGRKQEQRNIFAECVEALRKIYKNSPGRIVLDITTRENLSAKDISTLRRDIEKNTFEFLKLHHPIVSVQPLYEIMIRDIDSGLAARLDEKSETLFREMGDNEGWEYIASFNIGFTSVPGDLMRVNFSGSPGSSLVRLKSSIPLEVEFEYSLSDIIDSKLSGKLEQLRSHPKDKISILFLEVQDRFITYLAACCERPNVK